MSDKPLEFLTDVVVEAPTAYEHPVATARKIAAYLAGGAIKVVVLAISGVARLHSSDGERQVYAFGREFTGAPSPPPQT